MRLIPAVALVAAGSLLAACTAGGGAPGGSTGGRAASQAAHPPDRSAPTTLPATTTIPTTTVPATTTTAVPGGWTVVGSTAAGPAVEETSVSSPDGSVVVLLRFVAARTLLDLHVGSGDPATGGQPVPPAAAPEVTATQRPALLAAFNGGFRTNTASGGFQVDGVVLKPLVAGDASLVIDNGGRARVAVWGAGAPAPGESVASVRQNLLPLVSAGQPSPAIDQISAWGATLGGGAYVARSALGTDGAGNLVYAASRSAVPKDLSTALIDAGCVTAMELDINPEWVQADVAATPGASLTAALPTQSRPAAQYIDGWTRDFVTVQAAA